MRNTQLITFLVLAVVAFVLVLSYHRTYSNHRSKAQDNLEVFDVPLVENPVKIDSKCSAHTELSNVDFMHPKLRARLCEGTPAFTRVNGRFPICKVPWDLPLAHLISPEKVALPKMFPDSKTVNIYAHRGEVLTELVKNGYLENERVKMLISMIREFGLDKTTFLDIGCNVGVYALNIRSHGIKTVCVDGNIRNLVRVIMSAKEMGFDADRSFRIFWTFFNKNASIEHFRFTKAECHIGSGAPFLPNKISLQDPVPVASSQGDDLIGKMPTNLLVIKIDIESYEPVFLDTGKRFFDAYRVAVVQMEIQRSFVLPKLEIDFLEDFFFTRKFKLFTTTLQEGNLRKWTGGTEAVWVHEDFVPLLKNIPKQ